MRSNHDDDPSAEPVDDEAAALLSRWLQSRVAWVGDEEVGEVGEVGEVEPPLPPPSTTEPLQPIAPTQQPPQVIQPPPPPPPPPRSFTFRLLGARAKTISLRGEEDGDKTTDWNREHRPLRLAEEWTTEEEAGVRSMASRVAVDAAWILAQSRIPWVPWGSPDRLLLIVDDQNDRVRRKTKTGGGKARRGLRKPKSLHPQQPAHFSSYQPHRELWKGIRKWQKWKAKTQSNGSAAGKKRATSSPSTITNTSTSKTSKNTSNTSNASSTTTTTTSNKHRKPAAATAPRAASAQ